MLIHTAVLDNFNRAAQKGQNSEYYTVITLTPRTEL